MATRRRKFLEQTNEEVYQTMEEEFLPEPTEIVEVLPEAEDAQIPETEGVKQVDPAAKRTTRPAVSSKKHPRNIPRFSRERT